MRFELTVVMFTDQVESTRGTLRRTATEVAQVAQVQNELTSQAVHLCRGTLLKDTGDGAVIRFSSCRDATRCAALLQEYVNARNSSVVDGPLRFQLRIGIDLGEVIVQSNGDIRGTAANLAARLCSACAPGEVYLSDSVNSELHPREVHVTRIGPLSLKGFDGEVYGYRLQEWLGDPEHGAQPFLSRHGITDLSAFFDRHLEQSRLRAYIRASQNCQIVGPRKIGKTSLLRQLQQKASEWEKSSTVAYLDSQDPRCFTLASWLSHVGRQLGLTPAPTTLSDLAECVDVLLGRGTRLILCVDEFEELRQRSSEFTRDFFLTLRSCGQRGMTIVTASQTSLSKLTEPGDPSSPFYNIFPIIHLAGFSEADAADFVTMYRAGVRPFSSEERASILAFANGHPLALQIACFQVQQARESRVPLHAALEQASADIRNYLPRQSTE